VKKEIFYQDRMVKYRVSDHGIPREGERIHTRVNNRYITIFRNKAKLSVIDSICHHAGGPLTLGPLQEIEDLGVTVVLCPWHKYMVSIADGTKIYQAVEVINNKPVITGWTQGRMVQRSHIVTEDSSGIYVELMELNNEQIIASDADTCNERCAQDYNLHHVTPTPIN